MKKTITLLLFAVICIVGTTNAQRAQSTPIDELLNRLEQIGDNPGSISDYFTQEEQLQLRSHLAKKGVTKTFSQNVDTSTFDANSSFVSATITGTKSYNAPAGTATREAKGDQTRMPVVITHSATQTITAGEEIACASPTRFTDNWMYRAFDLAGDFGIAGDFDVTDAEVAIGIGVLTPAGFPMTVNIYSSTSQDVDTATLTLLGTGAATINVADSETIVSIPVAATVPAGEIMVLEVVIIDDLTDSNFMRFGCNSDGETGPSWILAPDCGAVVPTRFADLGLTQGLVMNVVGDEATAGGDNAWCVMNQGTPAGLGSFSTADGTVVNPIGPGSLSIDFEAAGAIDPADADTAYVLDNGGNAFSVDIPSGVYTALGPIAGDWLSGEFDPTTGTYYAIAGDGNLYTVDFGGGSATLVGFTGLTFGIALAIDGAGNAYTYDIVDDNFYSIDLGTGAASLIGAIGFDASFGQGMFWDAASDTVFMTAFNNTLFDSELRSVDTATGATTLINGMEAGVLTQYAWSSAAGVPVVGPPNDECAGAIDVNCGDVIVGETNTATDSGENAAPDLWYSFTGMGVVQDVTVSFCDGGTDYDSYVRIFDACGGTEIAGNDDTCGLQSEVTFSSDGASTYYIMVEGFGSNSGNFSMEITCNPDDPIGPPNDESVDAIAVDCGDVVVGETITATDSGENAANDLWYSFTGTLAGEEVTLSFCDGGTDYDSFVRVYDACGGALVVENDDTCGLQSEVTFTSDGATTYYIMVEGFGSNDGNFSMAVTCVSSGIEANNIAGFNYYPNPATNAINLSAQSNIETVAIYNVLGQKVIDQNVEATSTSINVANLSVGTYIMKVSVDGQIGTYKIVKQ